MLKQSLKKAEKGKQKTQETDEKQVIKWYIYPKNINQ